MQGEHNVTMSPASYPARSGLAFGPAAQVSRTSLPGWRHSTLRRERGMGDGNLAAHGGRTILEGIGDHSHPLQTSRTKDVAAE
eukprot:6172643-Pyramimonas_sp.AAC.1